MNLGFGIGLSTKSLLTGVCLLLTACEAKPDPGLPQSRDSAGVRIIENPSARDSKEVERLDANPPQIQIGAVGGEEAYLFQGPLEAVRLSSGGIVVLDRGLDEIRWFNTAGEHLHTAGGQGDGPGEFRNSNGLLLIPGDSILAHDEAFPRLTLFAPDGSFVRTWNLEPPPAELVDQINYFRPALFGRLRDGRTLHLASLGGNEPGHNRRTAVVLAFDTVGHWLGPLIEFPGGDWWVEAIPRGWRSEQGPGDRSAMAATDGETVYVGNGDDYSILAFDSNGTLSRIIRREADQRPANQAQIDSAVAQIREAATEIPEAQRPAFEKWVIEREARLQDRLSHYELMPAYYALELDQRHQVWVKTSRSGFEYDVFSPEGLWLRSVVLPSEPLFLTGNEAIFSRTGELGEPLVEVVSLLPGN